MRELLERARLSRLLDPHKIRHLADLSVRGHPRASAHERGPALPATTRGARASVRQAGARRKRPPGASAVFRLEKGLGRAACETDARPVVSPDARARGSARDAFASYLANRFGAAPALFCKSTCTWIHYSDPVVQRPLMWFSCGIYWGERSAKMWGITVALTYEIVRDAAGSLSLFLRCDPPGALDPLPVVRARKQNHNLLTGSPSTPTFNRTSF